MRILFLVNPVFNSEQIGILTLTAMLKQDRHSVSLLSMNGKSSHWLNEKIRQMEPDIVAYSAMSTEIRGFLQINRILKKKSKRKFKSIFGGPHPTFFPEMIEEEGVDAICRGEGEIALRQYIGYLNSSVSPDQVGNFLIKDGRRIIRNEIQPWIADLDSIPFPDRRIWDDIDEFPIEKCIYTTRGCPYHCGYCFNHAYNELYGNPRPVVRRRSLDNVMMELRQIITAYPDAFVFIHDDSFLHQPVSWLDEFKSRYKTEIGRPFGCNIRPNQLSETKARLLAEAGCRHCYFGLECGDEEIANRILGRQMTNEQILYASRLLKKYGIRMVTNVINALPVQNPVQVDVKSLDLCIECRPDFAYANIFFPFPKTRLERYAVENGFYEKNGIGFPDVLCHYSPLTFDPETKREVECQSKLFSLTVAFPILKRWLPLLRKLPFMKLYILIHLVHGGYCARFKLFPAVKRIQYIRYLILLFIKKIKTLKQSGALDG